MVKRRKLVRRANRAKGSSVVAVVALPVKRASIANNQAGAHGKSVRRVMAHRVRNVAHATTNVAAHAAQLAKVVAMSNAVHVQTRVMMAVRRNVHPVNGWIMTNASRCRTPMRCLPS